MGVYVEKMMTCSFFLLYVYLGKNNLCCWDDYFFEVKNEIEKEKLFNLLKLFIFNL